MIIDVFNHFMPKAYLERLRELIPNHAAITAFPRLKTLVDVDAETPAARSVRRFHAGAVACQSAARTGRPARRNAGPGAMRQRRARRNLPQTFRPLSSLHRRTADEQHECNAGGNRPRHRGARGPRRAGLHQCRRQAAERCGIPPFVPAHGRAQLADMGPSDARAGFLRLRRPRKRRRTRFGSALDGLTRPRPA